MKSAHAGFSMIEVLVAIALLVIGLLGIAALQTATTMAQLEAYQRSQALILVQDLADRMAANKASAASYVANNVGLTLGSCGALTGAAQDLCNWGNELYGTSEQTTGGVMTGGMMGARGCVTNPSAQVYMITVAWQGFSPAGEPAVACGSGAYNAGTRRAVSTILRVATLGA